MRTFVVTFLMILCLSVVGCVSKLVKPVDPAMMIAAMSGEEAAVVFLRPTQLGSGTQAPVAEAVDGQLRFVGIVSADTKLLYKTTPGRKFFVVGGGSSQLLEAEFAPGKTYYCAILPQEEGGVKARFAFVPYTNDDLLKDGFIRDWERCAWYENTPEGHAWFTKSLPSMRKKYAAALRAYQTTPTREKTTILPEFGIDDPVR